MKSDIQEIIISREDHRVLSANAQMWNLVDDDAGISMENSLIAEDREIFLQHLAAGDHIWFTMAFKRDPGIRYYACFTGDQSAKDPTEEANLRLLVVREDTLLAEHREAFYTLASYDAMLSLFEDLFFEYRPSDGTIRIYNAGRSRFDDGTYDFETFAGELRELTQEENLQILETFLEHVRKGTSRFAVNIPDNLFNRDQTVSGTVIKGCLAHHGGEAVSIIGLMHPQRLRGMEQSKLNYDSLTGLMCKEDITRITIDRIDVQHMRNTAIAIVDVDYFKHVNDNFGHQYGDLVLRQVAAILKAEVADQGIVGRIGGDEFFILFYHTDENTLRGHLRSIKMMVNSTFSGRGPQEDQAISVSVGTASYPQDADNYPDLFMIADHCLYLAKEKGRNRYIIYDRDVHPSLAQIKERRSHGRNIVNGRDDLPLGNALVQMQYLIHYGKRPPLVKLLSEFAERFSIPLLIFAEKERREVLFAAGVQSDEKNLMIPLLPTIMETEFAEEVPEKTGLWIVNDTENLPDALSETRRKLKDRNICSFILAPFTDAQGAEAALIFVSLHRRLFWNEEHHMYYRLFLDSISAYSIRNEQYSE